MENRIPLYLRQSSPEQAGLQKAKRAQLSFLNRTILNAGSTVKSIYLQAESATNESVVHRINPHVKLISLIYFEIVISIVRHPVAQLVTFVFIFLLYFVARVKVFQVYRKIFLLAFVFGFVIVLPASLNVISPGKIILNLITFTAPSHFWIYQIPQRIGLTMEGLQVVSLVFLRVINAVSFAMLVVYTTSFPELIKSFKIIRVPDTFLMIFSLAFKYIFILSRTIEETFFALKSRLVSHVHNRAIRKLISGIIFSIFKKSMRTYEDTWHAMVSRGYRGKVTLSASGPVTSRDFLALLIIVTLGIGILFI